jgi:hypothetical protein
MATKKPMEKVERQKMTTTVQGVMGYAIMDHMKRMMGPAIMKTIINKLGPDEAWGFIQPRVQQQLVEFGELLDKFNPETKKK